MAATMVMIAGDSSHSSGTTKTTKASSGMTIANAISAPVSMDLRSFAGTSAFSRKIRWLIRFT